MPNWAGSNWYYMRYCDPENNNDLADPKKLNYWLPVDWYNGGPEHITLHLLYSRFVYKFLFDIKKAPTKEPYNKRTLHGIVLAEDGRKMSKSLGNVVNPDDIVKEYGADSLRVYEMFMGPFDQSIAWSTESLNGVYKFLGKVWRLVLRCKDNKESSKEENKDDVGKEVIERMLILLAPIAPHIAEELWSEIGNKKSIFQEKWPEYNSDLAKEDVVTIVVQINGKVRDEIDVNSDISQKEVEKLAFDRKKVQNWIDDKEIKKTIFVPGKLINFVV